MSQSVNDRLKAELAELQATNKRSQILYVVLTLLVGGYLSWAYSQLAIIIDPEGMADAATGMAIDRIPVVSQKLQTAIQEAAPDLARTASDNVIEIIPMYRQRLESETKPIIDEVSGIIADAAIKQLLAASEEEPPSIIKKDMADSAATAVVVELDGILNASLDTPDEEGRTPRQSIEQSLDKLRSIDKELKMLRAGKGNPKERELLITWISLLTQAQDQAEMAQ